MKSTGTKGVEDVAKQESSLGREGCLELRPGIIVKCWSRIVRGILLVGRDFEVPEILVERDDG